MPDEKRCNKCAVLKSATPEFFYVQRARDGHKEGWESHCRECWKEINKANKKRIRQS